MKWLNAVQAAKALGVRRRALFNWRRSGRIRWWRQGPKQSPVRIPLSEVKRLLAEMTRARAKRGST